MGIISWLFPKKPDYIQEARDAFIVDMVKGEMLRFYDLNNSRPRLIRRRRLASSTRK